LWICRIFTSCRCICIRFNFFSWYLQNRFHVCHAVFSSLVSRLVFFANTPPKHDISV
jgi:hypothetical protein